jgi:hypothetical protein
VFDKKKQRGRSTELSTESQQDADPAKSEHGGRDRLGPESETVSDGFIELLVVEDDEE